MSGVTLDIITHGLSMYKWAPPIAQKKRKIGKEKRDAAQNETDKLLKVDFIRKAQYTTWLKNMVMVKKCNGRWRMCTYYTDLNKTCLKDAYPLSSIDRLVDGVGDHHILSFLDA